MHEVNSFHKLIFVNSLTCKAERDLVDLSCSSLQRQAITSLNLIELFINDIQRLSLLYKIKYFKIYILKIYSFRFMCIHGQEVKYRQCSAGVITHDFPYAHQQCMIPLVQLETIVQESMNFQDLCYEDIRDKLDVYLIIDMVLLSLVN